MQTKILVNGEENDKNKRKIISLKAINIKGLKLEDEDYPSKINKYVKLMFLKFNIFLRHEKTNFKFLVKN